MLHMKTIPKKFDEVVAQFPNKPALKFKYQGAYLSLSFTELKERVDSLAKSFHDMGLKKGERVAILSENRTEWIRADLATLKLGAISVPVHTTLSSEIIKHILQDSKAKFLLVSNQEQFNKISNIINDLPDLQVVIFITLDQKISLVGKELLDLEEVMEIGDESKAEFISDVNSDDVASIIYTSGTTALPKGVMLTHGNFMFNAEASATAVGINEKDTFLSFLPLSHVLERTAGYYGPLIARGACVAFAGSVKTLKEDLKLVRPTVMISVPRIFEKIHSGIWDKVNNGPDKKKKIFMWALKQDPGTFKHKIAELLVFKKIQTTFGGHLRFAVSGGASLNHKLARFFSRMGIKIIEGYGLTETSPVITVNRPDNIKFGTVGQHLPGVEVMIAKDKEILTRGPHIMKGYYNNDAMTKEMVDEEGWLHTGDLGFINSEGFLVIVGRKKEMLALSNGKIAWPEQLEVVLNTDRFISQSIVYGNKKSYLTALLVPDWSEVSRSLEEFGLTSREPGEFIKDEKLIKIFSDRVDKINSQLADWEKIRKFALLPGEFSQAKDELTPTMKLRRSQIEENNKQKIESFY